MDTALAQKELEEMLDKAVRQVTERTAGVQLYLGKHPPEGEDVCTVYITFQNGFQSSLTLRVNMAMLERMARLALQQEELSDQDLEDFGKEYFNILCGKIAALLFQATKVPARFSVPAFHMGWFEPADHDKQFVLTYMDDQHQHAQLTHHIPRREGGAK